MSSCIMSAPICPLRKAPADVSKPLDISSGTNNHVWVSELSPQCQLFVLFPTPHMISTWSRKTIPLVGILEEKESIFTRPCCKYRKLQSKLNFWSVVLKNKDSSSSYWQADRQLMRSSCRPVTFRLEVSWLFVADWVCDCAAHSHFQHPVDHG